MAKVKTNYVVACWMGSRRTEHAPNTADRSSFLRAHVHALERLAHSLGQVTVVLNQGGDLGAQTFARGLTRISGVPVKVLVRPNTGFSYAGWNLAHETFGNDFTHHIVVEDDYIPFQDNFDTTLVDLAECRNAYVCGLAIGGGTLAGISNGIIPERLWKNVRFPTLEGKRGARCQTIWSRAFYDSGYPIREYLDSHSSPFWERTLQWYGHPSLPPMFVPVQVLGYPTPLVATVRETKIQFNSDGSVVPSDKNAWASLKATALDDTCWRGRFQEK